MIVSIRRFGWLLSLLVSISIPTVAPIYAGGLAVNTNTLTLNIALGSQAHTSIQLSNHSNNSIDPLIYQAKPAAQRFANQPKTPLRVALPNQTARIDPQIAAQASDQKIAFLIFLADQADLSAAEGISNWAARGEYVYQLLQQHAEQSQAAIKKVLDQRGLHYRSFWIVNALEVEGSYADAQALAADQAVGLIRAVHTMALSEPGVSSNDTSDNCSPDAPGQPICWNIRAIAADRVWHELGVDGRGVTVATNDSGANVTHPALIKQYRGYHNGLLDHNYNWFDPQGSYFSPIDQIGHGTHVLGTIVGIGNGTSQQPSIGVAPGANWIAAQGCNNLFCTDGDLIATAQWFLGPTDQDGLHPRPDLRPMIVSNSWGGSGGADWYTGYINAWRAAGIFPVFAAGNASATLPQVCGSINSPGDNSQVVAVGATDGTGSIAPFSLFGPAKNGHTKPDLVAPGTYQAGKIGIQSSFIGTGAIYKTLQGTSMATPHIAGVVALLWSANPAFIGDYAATYAILTSTAKPIADGRCGDTLIAPNNIAGYGLVDAFGAVQAAKVRIPWFTISNSGPIAANGNGTISVDIDASRVPKPGIYQAQIQIYPGDLAQAPISVQLHITVQDIATAVNLSGRVTAADTGVAALAQVGVVGGQQTTTDPAGRYSLRLAPGTYQIEATAASYQRQVRSIKLSSATTSVDIILPADQPRLKTALATGPYTPTLKTAVNTNLMLSNTGTKPLQYQVYIPTEDFSAGRSDEPNGPAPGLIPMPANAKVVDFKKGDLAETPLNIEFPFYQHSFTETLVSKRGLIAFAEPVPTDLPMTRCLPDQSLYFYLIAPFRADLDPTRAGRVRYANITNQTGQAGFLLSYEAVPLRTGPISATYTFQIVLRPSGKIEFHYGDLAALPSQLSVGLERHPNDIEQLGCGPEAPVYPGLTIQFTPQPQSILWLTVNNSSGTLAPGATTQIPLSMIWMRASQLPLRGHLLIVTNDPLNQSVRLAIESQPQPAQYEVLLPIIVQNRT